MAEKPAAWAVAMAQSATASEAQRHHRRAPRFKNVIVELPQSGWEHVRGQEWTGGPRGYPACPTSRTVPTRLAAGRRALLPPPPARRRDPSPAPWAIHSPAYGNGRACASPSPGLSCRGRSRRRLLPLECRGRANWRAVYPRPWKAPPPRDPDARGISLPAREGDRVRLRRAARAPP